MSRRLFAALPVPDQAREHLVGALRPIRERDGGVLRFTDPDNWHITCAFYGEAAEDPDWLLDHLAVAAAAAAVDGAQCTDRWAEAEAEADPSTAHIAGDHFGRLTSSPMELYLSGAGSFSSRTLWIGVGGATQRLRSLMAGCVLDNHNDLDDQDDPATGYASGSTSKPASKRRSGRASGRGAKTKRALPAEQQRARQRAHLTVARAHNRLQDPWLLGDLTHALSVYRGPAWQATTIGLYESFLGEGRSGGPRYELIGEVEL